MAYIYYGLALNGRGEYVDAIADFDEAILLDPNDLASYGDRGKAKVAADRPDEARKDFEYVLARDSTTRQGQGALYHLAVLAYGRGEYRLSISYYDRVIAMITDDYEMYFNRGCAKGMLLDTKGAIADYDKAILLKPDYMEALGNRGISKLNMVTTKGNIFPPKEQTKDACADLEKAIKLGDKDVQDV
jgi:tetratricopeptide (TPR) repeat protein